MASTQEGSSNPGCKVGMKNFNTRRSWTTKEEETLLNALKDLVSQGWKTDNGFKPRYLNKLEVALKKADPRTDLKANPHINSKITTWKKNYCIVKDILSQSGVGFNLAGNFKIDCEDEVWADIVKTDKNLNAFRTKEWTFYEDWKTIFGKDRATGESAEDVLYARKEVLEPEPEPEGAKIGDSYFGEYHINLEDISETNKEVNSVCQSGQTKAAPKLKPKKRKSVEGIDRICDILSEISRNANLRLETLANRIGYDRDLGNARKEVYEKLRNLPELSKTQKFTVCEMICKQVAILEMFLGLPEEDRGDYVVHLLSQQ